MSQQTSGRLLPAPHRQRIESGRIATDSELSCVEAEIRKTEAAVDRYLAAFEAGSMPERQCGERVRTLSEKLVQLKGQREKIADEIAGGAAPAGVNTKALAAARKRISAARRSGSNEVRKALLRELVHEIRADGSREVFPTFYVPAEAVRIVSRVAAPTGFEPVSPP